MRLRIVGDAEAGVGAAALVVKLQRERMQVGVELRAQAEERLQPDARIVMTVRRFEQPGEEMEDDHQRAHAAAMICGRLQAREIVASDEHQAVRRRCRGGQDVIDDVGERPRPQQVEARWRPA